MLNCKVAILRNEQVELSFRSTMYNWQQGLHTVSTKKGRKTSSILYLHANSVTFVFQSEFS